MKFYYELYIQFEYILKVLFKSVYIYEFHGYLL